MQDILIGYCTAIIALWASLRNYNKLEPSWLRLIPWFLVVVLMFQFAAHFYWQITGKSNHFIFNLYTLAEYGFYMLLCFKAVSSRNFKLVICLFAAVFFIAYIYIIFFTGHFYFYNTLVRNLGAFLSFFCCIIFLTEILMAEEIIYFLAIPMFWIVTGIMITNVGTFLYFTFFDYILKNKLDPDGNIYIIITDSLTILEFGLFTIGIFSKRLWKNSSS